MESAQNAAVASRESGSAWSEYAYNMANAQARELDTCKRVLFMVPVGDEKEREIFMKWSGFE